MEIIKPRKLSYGDTIALITPSGPISDGRYEMIVKKAEPALQALGFKVRYGKYIRENIHQLWAGTVNERIEDFMSAFCDPAVHGIFTIRGGSVSLEIAGKLDYQRIKDRIDAHGAPVFIGHSDITTLHQALFKKLGLVTCHGINAINFTQDLPTYVIDSIVRTVTQTTEPGSILQGYSGSQVLPINTGTVLGKLRGGNLTSLASIMGTDHELTAINDEPIILFIEDIEEEPHRINRLLNQLIACPFFKKVVGIACGTFTNCVYKDNTKFKITLTDVIQEKAKQLNLPIAFGFPFGHTNDNVIIPNGVNAKLTVNSDFCDLEILESVVQ